MPRLKGRRNFLKLYYNELKINGSYPKTNNKIRSLEINSNITDTREKEYLHFQGCMSYLLAFGLLLGTNSIYGFTCKDPSALRFKKCSYRFLFLAFVTLIHGILSFICFYVLTQTLTLYTISYLAFYSWSVLIYFTFIRVAVKWPKLAHEITKSGLSEYLDPKCKMKCNLSLGVIMTLAAVEHCLSIMGIVLPLINCDPELDVYESYVLINWNWLFSLVPFTVSLGIIIQTLVSTNKTSYYLNNTTCTFPLRLPPDENIFISIKLTPMITLPNEMITIFSTLIQSYSDVFILCISYYLSSIFENINKKVSYDVNSILPPQKWQKLREDYNQATRLVRCFDNVVSSLVFLSFASNLFFICFQLFNVIGQGLYKNNLQIGAFKNCTIASETSGSSLSSGKYIRPIYHIYSVLFLVGRFIAVTLAAAKINNEAMAPALSLYKVPSISYCKDIERFLEQVNNDTVALSGLNFFYVTRGLLLSVIATIITYELVLLQYSDMGGLGQTI